MWIDLSRSRSSILYSPVTAAELCAGARAAEFAALDALVRTLTCIAITEEIGRRAGEHLRLYRKSHRVELGDVLIAATAIGSNAVLWTRNRKHYPMPGIVFYE